MYKEKAQGRIALERGMAVVSPEERPTLHIALIAHDRKKDDLVRLLTAYRPLLERHVLFATGTTGKRLREEVGLPVRPFASGPYGGDQQIGALIACNLIDAVIFLRDPLTAQPHEPDVSALLRVADVYDVPIATNEGTAEVLLRALGEGLLDFRAVYRGRAHGDGNDFCRRCADAFA